MTNIVELWETKVTDCGKLMVILWLGVLGLTNLHAQSDAYMSLNVYAGLTIYGKVGSNYTVQCISDFAQTNSEYNWQTLTNLTLPSNPYTWTDLSIPANGKRFYRLISSNGIPGNPNSARLTWISPGQFVMGSPSNEQERNNDETQHNVIISKGFYMGKYLVTQAEYQSVIGNNPSSFQGNPSYPVEQISWFEATNYCAVLTQREQSAGRCPTDWSYRLPTESEWEYACRAGTTTRFSYGDDLNYTSLGNYAWYRDNSADNADIPYQPFPHRVGQKLPNPWGLHDMHGNVYEWCLDWSSESLPGGSVTDLKSPGSGSYRVVRGGSFNGDAVTCRSACRRSALNGRYGFIGFRVVLASGQINRILITQQPESVKVNNGGTVTLQVEVTGPTGLRYQWRKDRVEMDGKTNAILVLTNVQTNDSGSYTVAVSAEGE